MSIDDDKNKLSENKKVLLKTIGKVVHEQRLLLNKGINKFSFEYDIGNGLLSRLERGDTDTQISTLWKLANAFDMSCKELVELIEQNLPKNFNFYD